MKRWPLYNPYFWEAAPFFRALVPLVAGIFIYDREWWPLLTDNAIIGMAVAALALLLVSAYALKGFAASRIFYFALFNLVFVITGFSVAYCNDDHRRADWYGHSGTIAKGYMARLAEEPAEKENSWKVPVNVIYNAHENAVSPVYGKALLYVYKDALPVSLHKGDSIWIPADWHGIKNAGNPYEFDYATWCRRNNIFHSQACSMKDIRLYATHDAASDNLPARAHDWCMQQLNTYIKGRQAQGLVQAMLLGDETNLDDELKQSYAATGIIHVIAISGGNVSVFFLVIAFLLRWLRHKKHQWIKYAIALPLIWFYVIMAGASPSAMRAALMFSLLAMGIMLQKNNNSLNLLFATAFILLCADPQWLFSLGFQLSFVAVLSIILFYDPIYQWVPAHYKKYKIQKTLWSAIAASIAAELLVAPLVIYYFHMFPLLFAVANAAAFLFMSIVLIGGTIIIVFSQVACIPVLAGFCVDKFVLWFDRIVDWLQQFNPASFYYLSLSSAELIVTYISIAGLLLFSMQHRKTALFSGLSATCVLVVMLCHDEWICLQQQQLIVYNAGKAGYTELISGRNYQVLYADTSATRKIAFISKPPHTIWHAWRQSYETPEGVYCIGGKTALVLDKEAPISGSFPADYLIVHNAAIPDADKLAGIFHPSVIVLGRKYSSNDVALFTIAAAKAGISTYSVADKGAFILNAPR